MVLLQAMHKADPWLTTAAVWPSTAPALLHLKLAPAACLLLILFIYPEAIHESLISDLSLSPSPPLRAASDADLAG